MIVRQVVPFTLYAVVAKVNGQADHVIRYTDNLRKAATITHSARKHAPSNYHFILREMIQTRQCRQRTTFRRVMNRDGSIDISRQRSPLMTDHSVEMRKITSLEDFLLACSQPASGIMIELTTSTGSMYHVIHDREDENDVFSLDLSSSSDEETQPDTYVKECGYKVL